MTPAAMGASVITQDGTGTPITDFAEVYQEWCTLSDKGEAGVFTIPVADVVKFIGEAIAKGH
jgi:hypothetical protein